MNAAVLKGLLALVAALVFFGVSLALFVTRRSRASALQALGLGCFGIMALTHVFEAFAVFPKLGWGHPRSIGHYIDLTAALSGIALMVASFAFRQRHVGVG
jgi:hypothetical protein